MIVTAHENIILVLHGIQVLYQTSFCASGDGSRHIWHHWFLRVSRFNRVTGDNVVDFCHHKNTDHFLRPALEVMAIEVRDVGDRESGSFVVGHVVGVG